MNKMLLDGETRRDTSREREGKGQREGRQNITEESSQSIIQCNICGL